MIRLSGLKKTLSILKLRADLLVLCARLKAGNLIQEESLPVRFYGDDQSRFVPLFCFGHELGNKDWTHESLAYP